MHTLYMSTQVPGNQMAHDLIRHHPYPDSEDFSQLIISSNSIRLLNIIGQGTLYTMCESVLCTLAIVSLAVGTACCWYRLLLVSLIPRPLFPPSTWPGYEASCWYTLEIGPISDQE